MAEKFIMKNLTTGETKFGFLGFSWTMLFFTWIVPLCRGDFLTFFTVIGLIFAALLSVLYNASMLTFLFIFWTWIVIQIYFGFFYNK